MNKTSSRRFEIYFPMTADILTPGHIKCLEYLVKLGFVTIGLLDDTAVKGYKKTVFSFKDRKYILETIAIAIGKIDVVAQSSLDPSANIRKYKCNAIASGDGFEGVEVKAIKKYKLEAIGIVLHGEKMKTYSSSSIKNKCKNG